MREEVDGRCGICRSCVGTFFVLFVDAKWRLRAPLAPITSKVKFQSLVNERSLPVQRRLWWPGEVRRGSVREWRMHDGWMSSRRRRGYLNK